MLINNNEYFEILETIKTQIKVAQHKAVLGANREMILLYWQIGKTIIAHTKYGAKFVENLARDIKAEFPGAKGYSARNLKYMRKFAAVIDDEEKVQTLSALLSWSHNTLLLDKAKTQEEIVWYAKQTIENGWSLSALEYQLETKVYQRQAIADKTSNYDRLLSAPLSALAEETLKNPSFSISSKNVKESLNGKSNTNWLPILQRPLWNSAPALPLSATNITLKSAKRIITLTFYSTTQNSVAMW